MYHIDGGRLVVWLCLVCSFAPSICDAKGPVQVRGYYRKDGTYVAPYTRGTPGSASPSSNSSGSWTHPKFPSKTTARTGFRTAARVLPRSAAAHSSLGGSDELEDVDSEQAEMNPKSVTSPEGAAAEAAEREAALEKKKADAEAEQASEEDEKKAAARLKRIKLLIAEKKGVISNNMKNSLQEIVKNYPTTAAAKEAQKLLDE